MAAIANLASAADVADVVMGDFGFDAIAPPSPSLSYSDVEVNGASQPLPPPPPLDLTSQQRADMLPKAPRGPFGSGWIYIMVKSFEAHTQKLGPMGLVPRIF